jgi:hypothetical protein
MIDDLLKLKKISQPEYDLYILFQTNELGRKTLDRMMQDTFMDEPSDKEFGGVGFAFYDGRRSVFRDIHRTILKVQYLIKELQNDTGQPEPDKPKRKRK